MKILSQRKEVNLFTNSHYIFKQCALFLTCLFSTAVTANTSLNSTDSIAKDPANLTADPVYIDPISTQLIKKMQKAIAWQRERVNAGGWNTLSFDELLEPGSEGPFVAALANRLVQSGDLSKESCKTHLFTNPDKDIIPCPYDAEIEEAVKNFQQRHGLSVDGVVGKNTLSELNIPATVRFAQLKLNYQRMIEFAGLTNEEYVLVNIPEFKLRYINEGEVILKKRIVVGKPSWETPSFSDQIEKFVVNPTWRIPLSITTKEIAPKVAEDPDYLAKKNIEIRKNSYLDNDTLSADEIDWQAITPYDFDHFLVKRAGKNNPLGEIKYLFPNVNAVYIHDTSAKNWFEQPKRAASHGCIRMEQPFSLAKAIVKQQEQKAVIQNIEYAREIDKTQTFYLDDPVPIHLVYWTAWVDEKNKINYRADIYDRDNNLHLFQSTKSMIAASN